MSSIMREKILQAHGRYLNVSDFTSRVMGEGERRREKGGEGGTMYQHESQFLRGRSLENGVIDHANFASFAIRIITLFEFSVKSSIFITTS